MEIQATWWVHRQKEKRKEEIQLETGVGGILNVGTMSGKAKVLVDMIIWGKVDVLCVQKTR